MIYYKLDQEIKLDKLVNDLGKLLKKQTDLESKVLVISVQKIVNYADDSLPPRIEYRDDSLT